MGDYNKKNLVSQIISHEHFGSIRFIASDNGEIRWVGKDVADILGYSNSRKALADHVDDEDKDDVTIRDAIGRLQKMTVINESGLYSLILSSKLPKAKEFKRWITSEVIPAIRKSGCYIAPELLEDDEVDEYTDSDADTILIDENPLPADRSKMRVKYSNPVLTFDSAADEANFNGKDITTPDTIFSPKDKVSNRTWDNKLPIGRHMGVVTVRKSENFGCVVKLDYESIINSDDVVTGAELSKFDRCVYDAVVTLFVTGYTAFSTTDILRIISHNPQAKLTPVTRDKIIKSMFHISRFWLSIITDDSEKFDVWCSLSRNSPFNSERKYYKNLQATYTGRLLDFRVIGNITFDVSYDLDGRTITEKMSFADIWKLGFPPILYQYAKAKGQVSSVPLPLLDTSKKPDKKNSLKRGSHNDELTHFLSREIDTMKKTAKRKQPYSRIILLERVYKIDGIDSIQQSTNDIKQKKFVTRQKLEKILSRFKENGMINGHTFHKKTIGKSLTFHSVEIFI